MRIKTIRATPVRVPVTRTGTMSGAKRTHVSRTIVEVQTDTGLTGIGETRGEWAASIINDRFAPKLIGLPVAERQTARAACVRKHIDFGFPEQLLDLSAFAGVELALWDLLGKQTGWPLFRLLGGPIRERAPFVAYAYTVDLDEGHTEADVPGLMADIAARSVAETGATMFEFKVGVHSLTCEMATVHAVRQAIGPEVQLAVDANMGFTVDEARRFLNGVAEAHLTNIEEPVPALADLARLRGEFDVPVSTHCFNLDALKPYPMIDAVVSDLHLHGGIDGTIEMITSARAQERRFWLRSMWELGISWAAIAHLGMVRPELDRPAQSLINWVADDLILGEPWVVRDGGVRPPETPGLGVELDHEALLSFAMT